MSIRLILVQMSQKIFTLPSVLVVLTLTCSGGLAQADSKSEKWLSPAASAAKKNPITSTPESIGAGQKIYSKTCVMCHGKTGDADGPAVIELNIHPAKLSGSTAWRRNQTDRSSGRLQPARNRCRHTANDFQKQIAGI